MTKNRYGFQVVSEKLEYQNPYMLVYRQEVVRPDGKQRPYWIFDRQGDFSLIIPIFPDETTMLVGQYRVPTQRYSWEFPMGMVVGATALHTAKKELKQETGLQAKEWKKIGQFYLAPGFSRQQSHLYIARELIQGESEPEEDEHITTKRVTLRRVKEMIEEGIIVDVPSILAFHTFNDKANKYL